MSYIQLYNVQTILKLNRVNPMECFSSEVLALGFQQALSLTNQPFQCLAIQTSTAGFDQYLIKILQLNYTDGCSMFGQT